MADLPPLQKYQIPLLLLNNIFALSLKPGPFRILFTLPILILLAWQSVLREYEQYFGDEYPLNVMVWTCIFTYLDWILLSSPDRERWHRIHYGKTSDAGDKRDGKNDIVPQSFFSRAWWALRLAIQTRHIGWSQQVKNVRMEVDADYPRWKFIIRKTLRAAWMYLLTDTIYAYTASTQHGNYRGYENEKGIVGFTDLPLSRKFTLAWLQIILTYTSLEFFNTAAGVIAVATGLANPRDCPSSFGDLKETYTIRKAWGTAWHQNMRRFCSAPATFITRDILQLRKGSFASKYLQLFIAFAVSTSMHAGGVMLTHRSIAKGKYDVAYFMAQPVAILIEDHVIDLGRHLGLRDSPAWRMVGYIWTVAWFGLSTIRYADSMVSSGMWIHDKNMYRNVLGIGPEF
ncbi:membrane bound O-acyl transferase family-domain-containing protein [Lophiotrema nucula]|uniref:Membrane bound O-acyl transferase family-domain-containing protein n=1 Tax=Lophiotrema nucula TaxID=690887 RepID=A0A6A5ZE83_9PLEO|nr:membrane bound O-acyl transferase family-domain-containing protein [Lophiotrema nucula]